MRSHCLLTVLAVAVLTAAAFCPGCRSRSRLDATLPGAVIHYDGMTVDTAPKAPAPDPALKPAAPKPPAIDKPAPPPAVELAPVFTPAPAPPQTLKTQ